MSKALRVVAIILMGLAVAFTLLGGVGTTCVAWGAEKWPGFAALIPYKPVYQVLTILTLLDALAGLHATYALLRGQKRSYEEAVIVLVVGLILAGVQMYFSNMLRGKTAPTNMRFYITALALLVFLVLRLPGLRVSFDRRPGGAGALGAGGLTLFMAGITALSTPAWAGPSHTIDGYNLVYVLQGPLTIGGWLVAAAGLGLFLAATLWAPYRRSLEEKGIA